ncbi:NAD(P)-dependent oxidoreductase [Pseudalkalibacillus sp. SCS-8]|uniref:NAD-dependent epimerase/dehydratase family protein n=1 Tax=Pseudalkalibacillus nanhaiensis TaxID=3115291 RepID=UPI0032DBC289
MKTARKRILITGGSGYTGRHAFNYAMNSGMEVTCIGRKLDEQDTEIANHFIACNLHDLDHINQLMKQYQPDYVLHLAGFNDAALSWTSPHSCLTTNVVGTLNLLEALRNHSPSSRSLIIGSALQFQPHIENPPHPYSLSKTMQVLLSEAWRDLFSLDIKVAKPSNLIGPGPSNGICSIIARKITAAECSGGSIDIHIDNGLDQRDFIDIRDVVDAYFKILTAETRQMFFEIGSGTSRTMKEMMSYYKGLTEQPFTVNYKQMKAASPVKTDLTAIQSIGWTPSYSLHTSLKDTLSYQRSQI